MPDKPGVYLMKNKKGKIIYVGKAVNLKNRVKSYFSSQHHDSPKTQFLVKNIADIEYIVTDSEIEALILESNLIKKNLPKYNVRLTDDKHYPYLRVTVQEAYPRLEIARRISKDGAKYFGPYPQSSAVHETIRLLKKLFPIRSCKKSLAEKQERPCLNAHIARCSAPCVGKIDKEAYGKIIDEVILFLEGKQEDLIKLLKMKMNEAAENLEYERAGELRDQLSAVEKVIAKQKIISGSLTDIDVINYARSKEDTCVEVFFIRGGKLLGRDHFFLDGSQHEETQAILNAFSKQYYSQQEYIPGEILLPHTIDDIELLEAWLTERKGKKVHIKIPKLGEKRHLMEMVGENAKESLLQAAAKRTLQKENSQAALSELQRVLGLPEEPSRIECYDISHIQGAETVASMVVFQNGQAKKDLYRRFKIETVDGVDDFASMAEVITRRLKKAEEKYEKFLPLPDLIIIDGGKGQLSSARAVMHSLGFGKIPTISLAKKEEWVFMEDAKEPIILARSSQGLYLLQRIRDEAHRFAITYHKLLRGKRNLVSVLDSIPGVGPKRKKAILKHFSFSLKKITTASLQEIKEVEGMDHKTAQNVWEYFNPQ